MATNRQIVNMIATIKTIYPYYAKEGNADLIVSTWTILLEDYTDDEVKRAFKQALKTCKVPPTPADVIEQIEKFDSIDDVNANTLWIELDNALYDCSKYMYRFQFPTDRPKAEDDLTKLYEGLSPQIKEYLGGVSELMRLCKYSDKDLQFEKTRFLKELPNIKVKQRYIAIAGGSNKLIGDGK